MTYAGRLDPLAEGVLIILTGDECKKKDLYLGLDKEYQVEILLGVSSDTGDALGVVKTKDRSNTYDIKNKDEAYSLEIIKEKVTTLIGKRKEKYPAYSSKPVHGKPLFMHAREGNIDAIEIPQKEIEIYSIDVLSVVEVGLNELVDRATERVGKVKGDFRQTESIKSWHSLMELYMSGQIPKFHLIKIRAHVSPGAYMRTLAEKLGKLLGTRALAWKIKRTKIGEYTE